MICTTSNVINRSSGKDSIIASRDDITGDIIRYIDVDSLLNNDASAKRSSSAADTSYNRIIVVPDEDELEAESKTKELEERLKRREEEMKLFRQLKREEEAALTAVNEDSASASGESGDQVDETTINEVVNEAPSEQGIWAWRGKKEMGSALAPAWRGRRKDTMETAMGNHKRASYFTRKMINWMNFNKANLARKSGAKKGVKKSVSMSTSGKQLITGPRKDSARQFLSLSHHTMGKDAEARSSARAQFLKLNPSGMGDSLREELMS